ncbi:MAG: efflux transporter outer membrane subunit [Herminiimonas sp.]|nr:efflux transporter outer membrane subunit [Herminiimonas sp.]
MTHRPPSRVRSPVLQLTLRLIFQPRSQRFLEPRLHPLLLALPLLLSACAVGPSYVRPTVEAPAAYKENAGWTDWTGWTGWKQAQPQDATLRGPWWETYADPLLDSLVAQVSVSNQNLAQADARFREARALVQSARAGYFPTIGANLSSSRSSGRSSQNTTTTTTTTGVTTASQSGPSNSNTLTLDASWEIDLWGRVQRTVEAQRAGAQASAGDLEATRLSAQAQLAQTYFALRFIDSQADLLQRTLADYQRSVQLTQNQYDAGIIAKANLILAQTQLKTTQAQALDLGVQRAQFEHAIALLVGKAPADFSISHAQLAAAVPVIPVSMPSDLLERRPDVAAAERRVAAANAQIGIAKAAYFPRLSLSATGGAQSSTLGNLLSLPNRFWSLGPALAATLFDGGVRRAGVEQASAAYDGTVAAYRQTVLTGFQEVEDNLAALRILEQEAAVQDEALQLSRRSVELITNQYKAGIVTYLNVIQVQASALTSERAALDILNRRLAASVLLVKALGGGWNAAALPSTAPVK